VNVCLPYSLDLDLQLNGRLYTLSLTLAPRRDRLASRFRAGRAVRCYRSSPDLRRERLAHPLYDLISALPAARTAEGDAALTHRRVIAVPTACSLPAWRRPRCLCRCGLLRASAPPRSVGRRAGHPTLYFPPPCRSRANQSTGAGCAAPPPVPTEIADIPPGRQVCVLTYASATTTRPCSKSPAASTIHLARPYRHLSFVKVIHYCSADPRARLHRFAVRHGALPASLPATGRTSISIVLPHDDPAPALQVMFAVDPVAV